MRIGDVVVPRGPGAPASFVAVLPTTATDEQVRRLSTVLDGDVHRARQLLRRAEGAFVDLGSTRAAEDARVELRACGLRACRFEQRDVDAVPAAIAARVVSADGWRANETEGLYRASAARLVLDVVAESGETIEVHGDEIELLLSARLTEPGVLASTTELPYDLDGERGSHTTAGQSRTLWQVLDLYRRAGAPIRVLVPGTVLDGLGLRRYESGAALERLRAAIVRHVYWRTRGGALAAWTAQEQRMHPASWDRWSARARVVAATFDREDR